MTVRDDSAAAGTALHSAWEMLAVTAERRALGWRRLSETFYGPNERWVDDLLSGRLAIDLHHSIAWLDNNQEWFDGPLSNLRFYTQSRASLAPGALLDELEIDYAHLFVGPDEVPAPPYESVWLDIDAHSGRHIFGGPSTQAVEAIYNQYGVVLKPDHRDLPDHVATESEFCCHLCEQEALAWKEGAPELAKSLRAAEQEFTVNHLSLFVPNLCAALKSASPDSPYSIISDFLLAYLSVESGTPYIEIVTSIWNSPER